MAETNVAIVESLFGRDPANPQVAIADGYGLTVRVHHGHLVIEDGIGRHRRQRRYSRAQRTLRRLVILGHTGYVTLDALRWCADVGITVLHLDSDGTVLTVHGSAGADDARLRRAQAAAPSNPVGLEITRGLLLAKLEGQAAVVEKVLHAPTVGTFVRSLRQQLGEAADLLRCRDLEAQASNAYFGAWSVAADCRFADGCMCLAEGSPLLTVSASVEPSANSWSLWRSEPSPLLPLWTSLERGDPTYSWVSRRAPGWRPRAKGMTSTRTMGASNSRKTSPVSPTVRRMAC